ncbi:MAG: hypothetical protein MZW92_00550 [Comamonadaceae bacterium]|nr:hypothetical protein [Comamonadaceae bacterium]
MRLPMLQRQRDRAAGLNTAGFISGYRGSPLGGLDQALWKAKQHPRRAPHPLPARRQRGPRRHRRSGARSRSTCFPARSYDGVFAHVVRQGAGRGPLRRRVHATPTPPAPRGTAACWWWPATTTPPSSSTLPHQTEHMFTAAMMPVLAPGERAGVPRPRPARLGAVALLRAAGSAFKALADTVETLGLGRRRSAAGCRSSLPDGFRRCRPAASTSAGPTRRSRRKQRLLRPQALRGARLLPRQPAQPHRHRLRRDAAARHHRRAARPTSTCARRSTTWASTSAYAAEIGIRLYKVGMVWPLEAEGVRQLRRRAGGDPGGRGEAPVHRVPAQGAALQLARGRAPARHRQVRREGRMGAARTATGCCRPPAS